MTTATIETQATTTATEPTITFTVASQVLRGLLRSVLFAADRDPEHSRYALQGVLLEFTHDTITACATDGRRLVSRSIESHDPERPRFTMVLPLEGAGKLCAIPKRKASQQVTVTVANIAIDPAADRCPDYPVQFDWMHCDEHRTVTVEESPGRYPRVEEYRPAENVIRKRLLQRVLHCVIDPPPEHTPLDRVRLDSDGRLVRDPVQLHVEKLENQHVDVVLDYGMLSEYLDTLSPGDRYRIYVASPKYGGCSEMPVYIYDDSGRVYCQMPLEDDRVRDARRRRH